MDLRSKINTIGFQSAINAFLSYGIAITLLVILMIQLVTVEFSNIVTDHNIKDSETLIHLIETSITSYINEINLEAEKSIILNTVIDPDRTQYYIEDYTKEINIGGLKGHIDILAFDMSKIYCSPIKTGTENTSWISKNSPSTNLENDQGLVSFSVPITYNNIPEGYFVYSVNFKEIFNNAIKRLFKETRSNQFKVYINNTLLISTKKLSDQNISYKSQLESLPITIEVLTPRSVIDTPTDKLKRGFILFSVIFSIISVLIISILTSRSLAIPLKNLRSDIEKITNSTNESVKLKKNTAKEIVFVGNAFNKLHSSLIKRTRELEERNKEINKANKNLKSTQQKLIQSEKMASIGQLAAGVAHEINNPTGFVNTNLQTLKEYIEVFIKLFDLYEKFSKEPEGKDKFLNEISNLKESEDMEFILSDITSLISESLDGTKRIKDIVQGLRDFARKDQEQFQLGNVNNSIEDAIRLTWNEIKYKCKVNKKLDDVPDIICNQDQLTQVFVNLLINSTHAIDGTGTIYIYSTLKNDTIIVRFSDSGSGISKENLSKLFDPFFSTKDVGKGTGLGLAISHGIIEKHNGTIEAKSKVNYGTCFIIKLPVRTTL